MVGAQDDVEWAEQPHPGAGVEKGGGGRKNLIKELQMENYNLKVQLEGRKYLVRKFDDLVEGERQRHQNEKLALIDRLSESRQQLGVLEQKLLQREAPKGTVRDAEIHTVQADAHERAQEQEMQPAGQGDIERPFNL